MFWTLLGLTLAVLLYVYAYRGILNQKNLSDGKRLLRKSILGVIIIIHAVCIYFSFYYYKSTETYSEMMAEPTLYYKNCGTVTKKIEGYKSTDKTTNYEEQIVIHYNNGEIERKDVSRRTFDSYEVGAGICFAEETEWNKLWHLLMCIVWIFALVGGVISFLYAVETVFD